MTTIPAFQRENRTKLAIYLETLPADYEHFEMSDFIFSNGDTDALTQYALHNGGVPNCGTAACAIGHGPSAGVLFPLDPRFFDHRGGPNWVAYTTKFFVDFMSYEFDWMFGGCWSEMDNTPKGAAQRIRFLLDGNPVPKQYDEDDVDFENNLWTKEIYS